MLMRTLLGAAGSASVAASNMIVALIVMRGESESIYGFYSFYVIFLAFFGAVSNSLFSTALLYIESSKGKTEVAALNVYFCALSGLLFLFGASWFLQGFYDSLIIAIHALVYLIRWYLRYYKQTELKSNLVVISDLLYGLSLTLLCVCWYIYGYTYLSTVLIGMVVCLAISIFPIFDKMSFSFGYGFWPFKDYMVAFKSRVRFSLPGVLFNEVISNGHVYVIFLVLGAASYAPVAAVMLLYRPVNIVFQTMFQIERPRMRSRMKLDGHIGAWYVGKLVGLGLSALIVNSLIIVLVMTSFRDELPALEGSNVEILIFVFLIYNFIRLIRNPLWIFLQSIDAFKFTYQLSGSVAAIYVLIMGGVLVSDVFPVVYVVPVAEFVLTLFALVKVLKYRNVYL
ncbi:hypothetical protein [Thalassolituus sp.]|uniref:hypothetical protein n=1 Tax=Thalassolituus sp. TaxID=2030822 RepID=UPI0035170CC6